MIDLDQIKGLKSPPPRREFLLLILTFGAIGYAAWHHHWLTWITYCGVASLALFVSYGVALLMIRRDAKLDISLKIMALLVLLIALCGGIVFGALGMLLGDAVRASLLDSSRPPFVRALAGMAVASVLGAYLYRFKKGMRGLYGSAEILAAVVVVWFTAYLGPGAAPSVPLFILAILSAAFLVSQGLENLRAGLVGTEDLFAALVLDGFSRDKKANKT